MTWLHFHNFRIMTKNKIIIDTDCGVDDAGALLIALDDHKQGKVKILAITTAFGNTSVDYVDKNVCRVLELAKVTDVSASHIMRLVPKASSLSSFGRSRSSVVPKRVWWSSTSESTGCTVSMA